jgi:hypothetical protein
MQETTKTLGFVGVAVAFVGAAVASHFVNKPRSSSDFELVGKPFYETFDSTEQAKTLEVSAVDPETGTLKRFSVSEQDGLWRIPSHYNYPAEAASRLAETGSSVMGLNRQTLVGRQKDDYKRFGVIDPLGDDVFDDPEAVGKRIQLKDGDDETLVDFIIGKEAGETVLAETDRPFQNDAEAPKNYYVRRADEQQTYSVPLKLDLSTRFADWINPDLLQIDPQNLVEIKINNYSIEERGSGPFGQVRELFKQQGDEIKVTRIDPADPWILEGLNDEIESLKIPQITSVVNVLDNMALAGVRPRFKFNDQILLTPELGLAKIPELEKAPREKSQVVGQLQRELMAKGFNFGGTQEKLELVSEFGELEVGTSAGVRYRIHVGTTVEGEGDAIEIGSPNETKPETPENSNGGLEDESSTDGDGDNSDPESTEVVEEDESLNRYVFLRVEFDPTLLGEKPAKPVLPPKPVQPEGYVPPADAPTTPNDVGAENEVDGDAEDKQNDQAEPEDGESPPTPTTKAEEKRDPKFIAFDLDLDAYEKAEVEFELKASQFEDELKQYNEKIESGNNLVKELNERFGEWYYVISASNLKTLQSTRLDLVEVKAPPTGAPSTAAEGAGGVDTGLPNLEGFKKPPETLNTEPKTGAEEMSEPKEGSEPSEETDDEAKKEPAPTSEDAAPKPDDETTNETSTTEEKADDKNMDDKKPPTKDDEPNC